MTERRAARSAVLAAHRVRRGGASCRCWSTSAGWTGSRSRRGAAVLANVALVFSLWAAGARTTREAGTRLAQAGAPAARGPRRAACQPPAAAEGAEQGRPPEARRTAASTRRRVKRRGPPRSEGWPEEEGSDGAVVVRLRGVEPPASVRPMWPLVPVHLGDVTCVRILRAVVRSSPRRPSPPLLVQPLDRASVVRRCGLRPPVPFSETTAPPRRPRITEPARRPRPETARRGVRLRVRRRAAEADVTFECKLEGPSQAPRLDRLHRRRAQRRRDDQRGSKSVHRARPSAPTRSRSGPPTPRPRRQHRGDPCDAHVGRRRARLAADRPPPTTPRPRHVHHLGADRWHLFPTSASTTPRDEDVSDGECTLERHAAELQRRPGELPRHGAGDYLFTVAAVDGTGNGRPHPGQGALDGAVTTRSSRRTPRVETSARQRLLPGHLLDQRRSEVPTSSRPSRASSRWSSSPPAARAAAPSRSTCKDTLLKTVRPDLRPAPRSARPSRSARGAATALGRVRLEVLSQGKDVIVEGMGFSARR